MTEKQYQTALKILGKRIKAIRNNKKWSQLDIEVRSGIDRGDISKIENGKKNLEYLTLLRLAEALETTAYDLLRPEK